MGHGPPLSRSQGGPWVLTDPGYRQAQGPDAPRGYIPGYMPPGTPRWYTSLYMPPGTPWWVYHPVYASPVHPPGYTLYSTPLSYTQAHCTAVCLGG